MALETHPDKLPRDATPEEKKLAEEKFRDVRAGSATVGLCADRPLQINNAYEVLSDESKRQVCGYYLLPTCAWN